MSVCLSITEGHRKSLDPEPKPGTLAVGDYREDAFVHASQGTMNGQEHEQIQRAGRERDTSGHLYLSERPDGEGA